MAAFLGLLWPRLRQREPVALAVLCGVVTALAVPLVPPGLPILLAAAVGAAWGWWVHTPDVDDAPPPQTLAHAAAEEDAP
ncbi:hypothetical protein D3C71_1639580 [compost metagenome]